MINCQSITRALASCLLLIAGAAVAQPDRPPSPVAIKLVQKTTMVPTIPITGSVYSRNELQITAGISGELQFAAEPGTQVVAGDVLARIDSTPLRLQRDEQEAALDRARAQLSYLDAQLKRQKDLASSQAFAANDLEQTQSTRDVAASDLRIAELRIKQIDDQLGRSEVRAKFSGVVTQRLRREGETIATGTVIGRVTDTENLEVRVLAPLRYSGRVRAGHSIGVFGYESRFVGIVRSVVPAVDTRTQAFELRIDLPQEAFSAWTIGQLVSAAIPMRAARESLVVPRDALILRQDGTFVFRVNADNKAERIAVTTGESAGDMVAVEGELSEGDKIVIRGGETLTEGSEVNIIGAVLVEEPSVAAK
jgi:RND family efflux transporter MFP subunit